MMMRTTPLVVLLPLIFVAGSSSAAKPKYGRVSFDALSQKQGFNFDNNGKDPLGFVNTLTIGAVTIEPDVEVHHPTAAHLPPKSVGVLGSIAWGGGSADPIELTVYISAKNRERIEQLLHGGVADTSVKIDFVVYNYDPINKKYFKAFFPNSCPARGQIRKDSEGSPFKLGEKGAAVATPENWALSIVIGPANGVVQLTYGIPNAAATDKTWGTGY